MNELPVGDNALSSARMMRIMDGNTLATAQSVGRFRRKLNRYLKPAVLIVDELVTCPSTSAALTCCSDHQRDERALMVITTNRAFQHRS